VGVAVGLALGVAVGLWVKVSVMVGLTVKVGDTEWVWVMVKVEVHGVVHDDREPHGEEGRRRFKRRHKVHVRR
jgi:hypothetical protein